MEFIGPYNLSTQAWYRPVAVSEYGVDTIIDSIIATVPDAIVQEYDSGRTIHVLDKRRKKGACIINNDYIIDNTHIQNVINFFQKH